FTARLESVAGAPSPGAWGAVRDLPVLVVDDNATNRRILDETLRHWGMHPTCSADGSEALAALNTGAHFALAIIDGQMPGMDGFDLVENMRRRPDPRRPPILMMTSGGRSGDGDRCRRLGVAAYLTKPVRRAELRRAIKHVLGGSRVEMAACQ